MKFPFLRSKLKKILTFFIFLSSVLYIGCSFIIVNLFFSTSSLIDTEYRVEENNIDSTPIIVVGNNVKNITHLIEKNNKSYLYDPAMSRQLIKNYRIGTPEIHVKSLIGDQFIYAVHETPGKMGMLVGDGELRLRRKAYAHWKNTPLKNS